MNFQSLVNNLLSDTARDAVLFAPELCLCVAIVLLLLLRIPRATRGFPSIWIALAGAFVALVVATPTMLGGEQIERLELFSGLLIYDAMTVYFRGFLLLFAVLFFIFSWLSGIPERDAAPDVFTLVLGATLGMCLMASANHLLMVFLAVEMASVPSYVLAGLLRGQAKSSEAALKYAVYGAGAAGVMLYGISLLAGVTGSAHLPTIAAQLAQMSHEGQLASTTGTAMTLALGGLMIMVGLAFKLSAVPFHFWCPDVFEGATAEVNAFLSVASKAAALALLIRVCVGVGTVREDDSLRIWIGSSESMAAAEESPAGLFNVTSKEAGVEHPTATHAPLSVDQQATALRPVRMFIVYLVGFLAAITCTFGNLAAYGQTNIKRLLAYSTIAQAGYMMFPVAAAMALWDGTHSPEAVKAMGSLLFYVAIYLFMNLGAFAVVAFLRNEMGSEEIDDYAGLVKNSPGLVVCFSIILFSLIGLPPLAGFAGKFLIFAALTSAQLYTLLAIGGLNTVLGLFYYLRVVKVMSIDPEPESRPPVSLPLVSLRGAFVVGMTFFVVLMGVYWDVLKWVDTAVTQLWS